MFGNQAIDQFDQLSKADNLTELDLIVGNQLAELGSFGHFFGRYNPGRPSEMVWIDHRPDKWLQLYRSSGYLHHDPVNHRAMRSTAAFYWDAAHEGPMITPTQYRMTAAAHDFGLADGLCVPFRGESGVVSAFSLYSDDMQRFRRSVKEAGAALPLLFGMANQQMERIVSKQTGPPPALTPREREVLTWAAAGKSNEDIAVILGISKGTVGAHIKSAARKLGAHTKLQAVARAAYMHLILV